MKHTTIIALRRTHDVLLYMHSHETIQSSTTTRMKHKLLGQKTTEKRLFV